jgi:uncharacterized protein with PIN domain
MSDKREIKRCGMCGTPIDENNRTLSLEEYNQLTKEQLNNAKLDYGDCCAYDEREDNYVQVTKDMAIDAQDMNLEGKWIKW